jgi:hypothetical protein
MKKIQLKIDYLFSNSQEALNTDDIASDLEIVADDVISAAHFIQRELRKKLIKANLTPSLWKVDVKIQVVSSEDASFPFISKSSKQLRFDDDSNESQDPDPVKVLSESQSKEFEKWNYKTMRVTTTTRTKCITEVVNQNKSFETISLPQLFTGPLDFDMTCTISPYLKKPEEFTKTSVAVEYEKITYSNPIKLFFAWLF